MNSLGIEPSIVAFDDCYRDNNNILREFRSLSFEDGKPMPLKLLLTSFFSKIFAFLKNKIKKAQN